MKTRSVWIVIVTMGLCGLAGVLIGRHYPASPGAPPTANLRAKGGASAQNNRASRPAVHSPVSAATEAGGPRETLRFEEVIAALEEALAKPAGQRRHEAIRELARKVELSDVSRVLAQAESLLGRDRDIKFAFTQELLRRWAEADPQAALR